MSRDRASRRLVGRLGVALLFLASAGIPGRADAVEPSSTSVPKAIARGDAAWTARAEALEGRRARPERIGSAIDAYRDALALRPASAEAAWKLMRALHYAVAFTTLGDDEKAERLDDAVGLARDWVERLEDESSASAIDEGDRARVLFWSAIAWGARGQRAGLLTIVREGVAGRMHDCAERARALDPTVDGGGPLRLLSRLHATLPRVPFVSGWVDRDRAIPLAEEARAVDRDHPGNALVLALAILDVAPDRRDEARTLLERARRADPRPEARVEDLAIQEEAEAALQSLREGA